MEVFGVYLDVFPDVYEPAEDSSLLAKYAKNVKGKVLDMGCGCGIQALVCAKADEKNDVLGVDLNPHAILNSKSNAQKNNIKNTRFFVSNLFSNVNGKFDAILFNPPYLPTCKNEKLKGNINLAFDGGRNGRKITDKFLSEFSKFLKDNGTLLVVESSLAGIEKTLKKLKDIGFNATIIDEERFFFEKIVVIKAKPKKPTKKQRGYKTT